MTAEFEYAIRTGDAPVYVIYESLDAARTALYAQPAPVAAHPRLVKRPVGQSDAVWRPVEIEELL